MFTSMDYQYDKTGSKNSAYQYHGILYRVYYDVSNVTIKYNDTNNEQKKQTGAL